MLKKAKIILLASDNGVINLKGNYSLNPIEGSEKFDVYVTSDDEIKNNDWYINGLGKVSKFQPGISSTKYYKEQGIQKIISTTDNSLGRTNSVGNDGFMFDDSSTIMPDYPSPSLNFLTRLIKNLNQEGEESINEILVEYTSEGKVRVKPDNTITIKKLNSYWEREPLEILFQQFANRFVPTIGQINTKMEVSDWVAKNLI